MIVELIGCSGAGKTTLGRRLVEHAGPGADHHLATDLLVEQMHLPRLANAQVLNLVQDAAGLPYVVSSWSDHRPLFRLAWRTIGRHGGSVLGRVLDLRSVARRTGMHELARRRWPESTVLFDEGSVLIAYHLYGYTSAPFDDDELEAFARLAPLPDRVVFVRAPLDVLVERASTRDDPRRHLRGRDRATIEQALRRATALFEGLASTPTLRDRVVVVDNDDDFDVAQVAALAEELRATQPSSPIGPLGPHDRRHD